MTSQSNKPFHTYENASYDGGEMLDVDIDDNPTSNTAATVSAGPQSLSSSSSSSIGAGNVNLDYANNVSITNPTLPSQSAISAPTVTPATIAGPTQITNASSTTRSILPQATTVTARTNVNAIESPFADPNPESVTTPTNSANNSIIQSLTPAIVTNAAVSIVTKLMPSISPQTNTTDGVTGSASSNMTCNSQSNSIIGGNNLNNQYQQQQLSTAVTSSSLFSNSSPMDSIKEWSVSTFKCTKQLVNERLGKCTRTSELQLESEIERLRDNQRKYNCILKTAQQMNAQYSQLVQSQRQLCELMNEMALRYTVGPNTTNPTVSLEQSVCVAGSGTNGTTMTTTKSKSLHKSSVAASGYPNDFAPVLNHIKMTANTNIGEDFCKNALVLSISAKNGEKLIAALSFFCSNLTTLVNKTIEDTLCTVRAFESARLEYDAERNSMNHHLIHQISSTMQTTSVAATATTVTSDRLNLAKSRYEQLRQDVQIKMRFLDENKLKVMHKQLVLFNSAFAAYASGNTAALEAALKQFSIR